ncbi:MAG: hypothetical protein ACXWR0_05160 [Bdellovibrio sp.]
MSTFERSLLEFPSVKLSCCKNLQSVIISDEEMTLLLAVGALVINVVCEKCGSTNKLTFKSKNGPITISSQTFREKK